MFGFTTLAKKLELEERERSKRQFALHQAQQYCSVDTPIEELISRAKRIREYVHTGN